MHRRGSTVLVMLVALAALAGSATASAATFGGVVVHHDARARSFVVALRDGTLRAVHARTSPRLGRHVTVTARTLHNGTWALQRVSYGRLVRSVHVRGVVTYVNLHRHLFVVSARGVSLLVRTRGTRSGAARAADAPVADGQNVTVNGTLDGDAVEATQVTTGGQDTNGLDLEGTVQSVDTTTRTLTVSADDSEQSGATVTIDVPAAFDLGLFSTGQSVELIVSPNGDGTYTLEQSSNDTGAKNADNHHEDQGAGNGDHQSSAEQVCTAQQSDPNFAASHNGESFAQFYNSQDPTNVHDAFGHCIDAQAQQDGSGSGGSSQTSSGTSSGSSATNS